MREQERESTRARARERQREGQREGQEERIYKDTSNCTRQARGFCGEREIKRHRDTETESI